MMKFSDSPATFSMAKSILGVGVTPETEPKRSKTSTRGQASRLQGDSELTEPETEDDSLFGDDPGVIEPVPYQEEGPKADSLTTEQLLQRRLDNVKSLYSLYKVEYWGLVEELRTRHARFRNKQAERAAHHPEAQAQPDASAPAKKRGLEGASDLRSRIKRRRREQGVPGSGDGQPAVAAPGDRSGDGNQEAQQPDDADAVAPQLCEAEARGEEGSDEEPATFSDVEGALLEGEEPPDSSPPPASKAAVQAWRAAFRGKLPRVGRLEQAASGSAGREMDRAGAIACLCGRNNRFMIKNSAVSLGRATDTHQVDIDLSSEGDARKVSRLQAHLSLRPDARFQLKNVGRRTLLVNNRQVDQGQVAQMGHLSLVEVGGVRLLFMVNPAATKRAAARTLQLRA